MHQSRSYSSFGGSFNNVSSFQQSGYFQCNYQNTIDSKSNDPSNTSTTDSSTQIKSIKSKIPSSKIHYQVWSPIDLKIRGVVIICHGLNEHSGRYTKLKNELVSRHFAVFSFDLEGHGKSDGKPAFIDDFTMWIQNGIQFLDLIANGTLHLNTCDKDGKEIYSSSFSSESEINFTKNRKSLTSTLKRKIKSSGNIESIGNNSIIDHGYSPSKMKSIMEIICGMSDIDQFPSAQPLLPSLDKSRESDVDSYDSASIKNVDNSYNCQFNERKPIYLFGQGIGATVAMYMSIERPSFVDGMVLSAPMVTVPSELHAFLQKIAKGIATCLPNMSIMELKLHKRTHCQEEIENFKKDPLTIKEKLKAKCCFQILEMTKQFKEQDLSRIGTPFLVLQGSEDEYCDPSGASLLMEKTTLVQDKEIEICSGLYHDLLFEVCFENTLNRILDWFERRQKKIELGWR